MKNSIKTLVLLGLLTTGASLTLQFNAANSTASPGAVSVVYLPMAFRPRGPMFLPIVAKANPTPTPVTPTPIPGSLRNGGLEEANTATGPWYATRRDPATGAQEGIDVRKDKTTLASAGVTPHAGDYAAWLDDREYEIYLQQEITLPAGVTTLSYWAWIKSDEPNCNRDELDGAWLFFITNQQNQLESYALCKPNVTTGWVKHTLDISGYAGQTGWLTFVVRNLGQASSLFLDDIAAGTSANAPVGYSVLTATPVPSSQ